MYMFSIHTRWDCVPLLRLKPLQDSIQGLWLLLLGKQFLAYTQSDSFLPLFFLVAYGHPPSSLCLLQLRSDVMYHCAYSHSTWLNADYTISNEGSQINCKFSVSVCRFHWKNKRIADCQGQALCLTDEIATKIESSCDKMHCNIFNSLPKAFQ